MTEALCETQLDGQIAVTRGKVRDVYDLGDELVIVATDRISAFDWINPVGIPDKGKILTSMSMFWFEMIGDIVPNHVISADLKDLPPEFQAHPEQFEGRSMVVHKCHMFPVEFVIRGYLAGSGWKDYRETGSVCGIAMPEGLEESCRLEKPLFTPATKATDGHDLNISAEESGRIIGAERTEEIARLAEKIYIRGRDYAKGKGIILCDTKFEFGIFDGNVMLADEVLTPDSSRFWPMEGYKPGKGQPSFDKQFVRDWLETQDWDKNSPPPPLPEDIVEKTRAKYVEAYRLLTGGREF